MAGICDEDSSSIWRDQRISDRHCRVRAGVHHSYGSKNFKIYGRAQTDLDVVQLCYVRDRFRHALNDDSGASEIGTSQGQG